MKAPLVRVVMVAFCLLSQEILHAQSVPREIEISIFDGQTMRLLPCRIHLKDSAGLPVFGEGLPRWRDHFVCGGKVALHLPDGNYSYEIERGPEYRRKSGSFTINCETNSPIVLKLEHLVDMAAEGWWSGDMHVHRPIKDIELLMEAEDLHVAPVITWWNNQNLWTKQPAPKKHLVQFDRNRFYEIMAGEDEREGGALLYFNLLAPLPLAGASREFPSPMEFVAQARRQRGVWIDIEKPFWWDVPVWVASGQVDSIGIANNHMCRSQMYESEAWGKPRDASRLPAPLGNGYWSQEIYYHLLNCGLRIPPSAGSASGVLPNPVGYNRVYVHAGNTLTYEKWWKGLREGRSFVSNGPLLRCRANGKFPGHVFKAPAGTATGLKISGVLDSQDHVSSIEIIKNGKVERVVPVGDWKKFGMPGVLKFNESGWFLVRAIADNPKTFRFASSAPFYVEIGGNGRRVSRTSAQFFLDWVHERAQRIKLAEPLQREQVLHYHEKAVQFWSELLSRANAD